MQNNDTNKDMLGRDGLTLVDDALSLLQSHIQTIRLAIETVPLTEALDRVVAHAVVSPEDLPAAARSTMDGFAVRARDTFGASQSAPAYLQITGEVLMGQAPQDSVETGCCFKIATGGLLPPGADGVVMLEHTVPVDETMIEVVKGVGSGTNLIDRGDDIRLNDPALPQGQLLRPQDLGLLAGLGIEEISVYKQVRVGVLSTGDEIIPYNEPLTPGKIRNINTIALGGQARRSGALVTDYGIVSDEKEIFFPALQRAVEENDMVLFSGGSSVGMRDLGEQAIAMLGNPGILVHGVALKPGKPIIIGLTNNTPIFGLPGHPVSAMVCFDFFVKPAIEQLSGRQLQPEIPELSLTAELMRNINSAPGRRDLIRVQLTRTDQGWQATPVLGKSGSISTLSRSHGYFLINESSQGVVQGTTIQVYLFR